MDDEFEKLLENHPDKSALSRIGARVRSRLSVNPAAYKVPTQKAEIWAVGDFMTGAECEKVIELVDAVAKPSRVYEKEYGKSHRSSYSGDFDPYEPFIQKLQRRIDDLLGMDPGFGEIMQGQRYLPGQEFRSHYDWFSPNTSYWEREKKNGGQRAFTAMAFLNNVEAGGHTDFPGLGLSMEPQAGALLIWNNATPEGVPNRWTMHAGMPVEAGVKYVITKWYRSRKWS